MALVRAVENAEEIEPAELLIPPDYSDEPFWAYLNDLLNKRPADINYKNRIISVSLQTGAIAVGAFSGVPYIAPAVEFAGPYRIYGYFLGYGIFTSLGVVEAWAMLDIVSAMTSRSKEEKALLATRYTIGGEIAYWTIVPSLGIAAAYSVATLIYRFNDQSKFYFGVSMFTDSITNTAALNRFYLDAKYEYRRYFSSEPIRTIEIRRRELLYRLNKSIELLPALPLKDLQKLLLLKRSGDIKAFLTSILELSQKQIAIEQEHALWFDGVPKKIANVLAAAFPLAWAIFGLINSYHSFDMLISNAILSWIISTATNFPYLFLELTLACSLVNYLYGMTVGRCFDTFNSNIPQHFYPKHYFLAILLGLFTTANAFGARARFVTSEIPGGPGIALAVIVCISTIAYKSSAMVDIIRMIFENMAKKYGQENIKELITLVHTLQHFSSIIHDADPLKVEPFLNDLNDLSPIIKPVEMMPVDEDVSEADTLQVNNQLTAVKKSSWFSFWRNEQEETINADTNNHQRACMIL